MKRILFATALVAVIISACVNNTKPAPAAEPSWYTNEAYFAEKNGMYVEMPVYKGDIVMAGDDYIDRGDWNEFYGDSIFKNRGITYDATEHVLYRIQQIAASKPAKIFVSVGYNDILHGTPEVEIVDNIKAIFRNINVLSPETKCYYLNIVRRSGDTATEEQAAAIKAVNEKVAAAAKKFEYVDLDAVLADDIASGEYSWDGGKYLNGSGYQALTKAIEDKVGKSALNVADDKEYELEVSDYYKHKLSIYRSLPKNKRCIVMFGNSLNNNAPWKELFPFVNVINRGISGDVIEGVKQRVDEVAEHNPGKIFLLTGTNDIVNNNNVTVTELWSKYESLIKNIKLMCPMTILYVQSTLPMNPKSKFYEGTNEKVAALNKLLEAGQEKYSYVYLDIASLLSDENGDLKDEYTTDGIHLSCDGYFVWAAELAIGTRMMQMDIFMK